MITSCQKSVEYREEKEVIYMNNLIELEYVIDFLKQEPCIDMDLHEAYFSCPFCEKDYLDVFKKISYSLLNSSGVSKRYSTEIVVIVL